jgi:uncharacterized protein (TIGR02186 family)
MAMRGAILSLLAAVFVSCPLIAHGGEAPRQLQVQPRQPIVVEVAEPTIDIDIGFKGAELLVFGLVDAGTDAIVVVRGETRAETVRRKERFLGVWTTGASRTFLTVPAFYALAGSRPLDQMFPDEFMPNRFELGAGRLNFTPLDIVPGDPATEAFRDALLSYKRDQGLYAETSSVVKFVSEQLFRTTLHMPANVPLGRYTVRLYMVQGERVVAQRETYFVVNKVGIEEKVYRFAHQHGVLYGLFSVVLALLAGWLVTLFFRTRP